MESAPVATAAVRNGVVSMPPMAASSSFEPSHEEWRVVSEQSVRNPRNEELERSKVVRSDERLIFEQRLHNLVEKREELQNMELELRVQISARSEIMRLQNTFDAQIKEHANANAKLQEQLHDKEQKIHELERRMDEKEREVHAIRLDSEVVWAKEDLLREQSKEIQSCMRERDNADAERAQHIKQIHDLQEHIQEKECQFVELQEQHRIAQETVLFKDEQIREAQTWISRAQEIDAMQTTTNHTLQAELRERTEQYNQLWLACQRQFGEMERLHLHVQQLQLEMGDAREKSGSQSDVSHVSHTISNDASQLEHVNGIQLEVNDRNSPAANTSSLENGNAVTSEGSTFTQSDQVHGVAFAPSSMYGMPTYLPTALHSFVMHQHGVPHPSHVTQSAFQSVPVTSSVQNWQSQQSMSGGEHMPTHQYPEQTEENLNKQVHYVNYVDANIKSQLDAGSVIPSPRGEIEVGSLKMTLIHLSYAPSLQPFISWLYLCVFQVPDPVEEGHDKAQFQLHLEHISSQFHEALRLNPLNNGIATKENQVITVTGHGLDDRTLMKHSGFAINASSTDGQTISSTALSDASTNALVSMGKNSNLGGNLGENYLLDERAMLASVARAIGPGGRTRISSTLPNRLGKMLAPLHWHDYKKKYGKLDEFVAGHPDLFLIEGDHIQLREGAQKTIAATATAAKVAAAAAAAPSSFSSSLASSVAVTPMAHTKRSKRVS